MSVSGIYICGSIICDVCDISAFRDIIARGSDNRWRFKFKFITNTLSRDNLEHIAIDYRYNGSWIIARATFLLSFKFIVLAKSYAGDCSFFA
jgi:hypothetical protein